MAGSDHAMQSEHVPDSDAPRRAAAPKQQTGAAATAAGAVPVTGLRAAVPSPSATSLGARQVRAKSVVGAATDPAEREADHAADRALRMAAPEQNRPTAVDPTVADATSRGPGAATSIPPDIQRWPNAPAVPAPVSTPAPVPNRDAAAAGSNVWALDTVAAFSGVLGNAALVRLRHTGAAQAKKSVSEPGDAAEQQADRIAKATSGGGCCAECAGGMGCLADIIQRTPALKGSSGDSAVVESAVGASRPLEPRQRRFFEQRLGVPLDHVRVHTGEAATASADTVGARAYTLGRHMVFAAGQYAPQTTPGRELLAHELAHVAQQGSQEAAGPALVQRQAAPGSTMGPPPRPGADPQRPAGQAYYYRGVQMSSDREFMRGELRRLVARVGVRDADYWYKRMLQESGIPPEEPGGTALGITAHTIAGRPGVRSPLDIQQEMRRADEIQKLALSAVPAAAEVYPQIHVEAVVFLATFQAALGQTLLATLGESEKRLQAERIRYGITKTGEAGTTEYRAQNTVAFQGVVGAAKDLLALRQRINALWAQQHQLMGSRGKAGLFLPEENKPRYDALGAEMAKLEEQYAQELASASLRYPALGAVLDESSIRTAEERLEALASGNLTSRAGSPRMGWRGHVGAGSIGEVLDSRQQAIDKVRADVADDQDRLWKLDSIVALTKMRMGTSQLTMADKLIADKIQQIKEDAAFLAVALGVLAFALAIIAAIPTAGASLAVTATVTAATAGTLAISGYQLIKDVKEYQLQLALTNTDLNRRAQAIATEEPSMFWVALDLVSFVTDGAAALKAFQALKSEVRAALTAREGTAAAEAATRLEKAADAVPASKPGLGRKLLDSLAELRGRPEAARGWAWRPSARRVPWPRPARPSPRSPSRRPRSPISAPTRSRSPAPGIWSSAPTVAGCVSASPGNWPKTQTCYAGWRKQRPTRRRPGPHWTLQPRPTSPHYRMISSRRGGPGYWPKAAQKLSRQLKRRRRSLRFRRKRCCEAFPKKISTESYPA